MTTVCSLNEIKSESKENLKMINPKNKTVLVMPKKNKIPPLGESNGNTIHLNNNNHMIDNQKPAKRPRLSSGSTKVKGLPPPVAVARRNARERNRVKQVNNGFAALREKIPEEVAEAFEAAGNGRGTSKKLSKVETLRMAVEYIRSLERLLEIEPSDTSDYHFSFANSDGSDKSIMSSSSPEPDSFMSNYDDDSIHQNSMSPLPDITTINGVQYYRIPGTNAYQPFNDPVLYENEENMQPLPGEMITIVEQQPDEFITNPLVDPTVNYKNTLIAPIRITIPSASSPSGYSGQSLSPALNEIKQENVYTSVDPSTEHQHQTISNVLEDNGSDGSEYYLQHTNLSPHVRYQGVVTLHPEHSVNDIVLQDTQLTAESMIEVMDWWDKHQAEQKQLPHFDGIKPQTRLLIGTQSEPEETC